MDSSKSTQQHQGEKPGEQGGNGIGSKIREGVADTFKHHKANPGPAVPKDFNVAEEGTKEERRAKAQELNK